VLTLEYIKSRLPRAKIDIKRQCVRCPHPSVPAKYKSKRRRKYWRHDNSVAIFLDARAHYGFRVHSFRGDDWRGLNAWVRDQLGIEPWKPKPRTFKPKWNYFSAVIRLAKDRQAITEEQFGDLCNAIMEQGEERVAVARSLARIFGFDPEIGEGLAAREPRPVSAGERAAIWQTTYEEHRRLRLWRIGCSELDPEARRRMTRERENAKKRATRAGAKRRRAGIEALKLAMHDAMARVRCRVKDRVSRVKELVAVATVGVQVDREESLWIDSPVEEDRIQNLEALTSNCVRAARKTHKSMPEIREDSGLRPPRLARRPLRWPIAQAHAFALCRFLVEADRAMIGAL
jgi:hypothetical protein